MKKLIFILAIFFTFSVKAQTKDSLFAVITLDTIVFKNIVQLIQEHIQPNTLTNKIILQNILQPLYQNMKLENKFKQKIKPD